MRGLVRYSEEELEDLIEKGRVAEEAIPAGGYLEEADRWLESYIGFYIGDEYD